MKIKFRKKTVHNIPNYVKQWQDILQVIRRYTTSVSYDTWLKPLVPVSIDEKKRILTVKAENDFVYHVVKARYMDMLQGIAETVIGPGYQVSILNEDYQRGHIPAAKKAGVAL